MRTRALWLLAACLVTSFAAAGAAAAPSHYDGSYHGLAHEGSVDWAAEWHGGIGPVAGDQDCTQVAVATTYELVLPDGTAPDVLLLQVPDQDGNTHVATATQGSPAEVTVTQADTCAEFAVVGLLVSGEPEHAFALQPYVVHV